jgi:hypothetical protein
MYEPYTRQALPERYYRELLGTALCVFNANNAFIIENILRNDEKKAYTWFELIDKESGKLKGPIRDTISQKSDDIALKFDSIVEMRNRIIHSFQITSEDGTQMLATKTKINEGNIQFRITEDYLNTFIKANEDLAIALDTFRGENFPLCL